MEIGPIEPIRPVGGALPTHPDSAVDGVFAAEFRRQDHEPSRIPAARASRGLEDESPDDDPEIATPTPNPDSTVHFFA